MEPCLALIFTDRGPVPGWSTTDKESRDSKRPHELAGMDIGYCLEFSQTKLVCKLSGTSSCEEETRQAILQCAHDVKV